MTAAIISSVQGDAEQGRLISGNRSSIVTTLFGKQVGTTQDGTSVLSNQAHNDEFLAISFSSFASGEPTLRPLPLRLEKYPDIPIRSASRRVSIPRLNPAPRGHREDPVPLSRLSQALERPGIMRVLSRPLIPLREAPSIEEAIARSIRSQETLRPLLPLPHPETMGPDVVTTRGHTVASTQGGIIVLSDDVPEPLEARQEEVGGVLKLFRDAQRRARKEERRAKKLKKAEEVKEDEKATTPSKMPAIREEENLHEIPDNHGGEDSDDELTSPIIPRFFNRTLYEEALPQSLYSDSDAESIRITRGLLVKSCLDEKNRIVKTISASEDDRFKWSEYIVAYAKGKYNFSDPVEAPALMSRDEFLEINAFPAPTALDEFERLLTLRTISPVTTTIDVNTLKRVASATGVPNLTVTLIERWEEICIGSTNDSFPRVLARDQAFGAHAILSKEMMEICDLSKDWRFENHPWVRGSTGVKYFAAAPLITAEGFRIGACALYDSRVRRPLSALQRMRIVEMACVILQHLIHDRGDLTLSDTSLADIFDPVLDVPEEPGMRDEIVFPQDNVEDEAPPLPVRSPERLTSANRFIQNWQGIMIGPHIPSMISYPSIDGAAIQPKWTRKPGHGHTKGWPIHPFFRPGNKSAEIRFVAHEFAIRFNLGLLFVMRIIPINPYLPTKSLLHPSNFNFDILAAYGMDDILANMKFRPEPALFIKALQDSFGVVHDATKSRIDANNEIFCRHGLIAPIKREHWSVDLSTIYVHAEADRARRENCVGGVIIAAYDTVATKMHTGRDEIGELLALNEAGLLIHEMLVEFPPGSDYDPALFTQVLTGRDPYFDGFNLVADEHYMF